MLYSKNVYFLFCLILFSLTALASQCNKDMEPQMIAGFDIQRYSSPEVYQSLYIQKDQTDFTLVSAGERIVGQLTENEHSELLDLLQEEHREAYIENSLLETDPLPYPYLSIRERSATSSTGTSPFFVILALDVSAEIPARLVDLIDELFTKYGG